MKVAIICTTPQFKVGDMPPMGYIAWHDWAKVQYKGGLRQLFCPTNRKWEFPQEHRNHTLLDGAEHRGVPVRKEERGAMLTTDLTLREKLKALMVARDQATEASLDKDAFDHWLVGEGHHLQEIADAAKAQTAALEAEVREMALAEYHSTKDKHPGPGVKIKMKRIVGFSPDKALEWAREHQIALVPESLDEKKYRGFVLSGDAPGTVLDEPVAYVVRDLGKALKGD